MPIFTLRNVIIGLIATVTMDALNGGATKLRLIATLSPHSLGRWFASVARGRPVVKDINQMPPIKHEMVIAVSGHYAIGVTLALVYLLTTSSLGLTPRNPITALAFGVCTNVLPWLLMFPAMGYGVFGAHGPIGTRLFQSSLVNHLFYGVGLWLGVSILS